MEILKLAYKKHKVWINICKSFGLNKEDSEDIVMNMYIKLDQLTKKGTDISYNKDDINHYYIFKILYTSFLQLKKKENKYRIVKVDSDDQFVSKNNDVEFAMMEQKFNKEFSKLLWYDQRVFEIISSGKKISAFSRETNISYISLYNTYTRVKKLLKKKLGL